MRALLGCGVLTLLGCFTACSGDDFASDSSGGASGADASSGGTAGTLGGQAGTSNAGSGGTAGAGGVSGSAGVDASAGRGGDAGASEDGGSDASVDVIIVDDDCHMTGCAADEYCRDEGNCRKCADLSELRFGTPVPLNGINNGQPNKQLRHLRAITAKAAVYELAGGLGLTDRTLFITNDIQASAGLALAPIDSDGEGEGAPIVVPGATGTSLSIFFDQSTMVWGQHELWNAELSGTSLQNVVKLGAPLNEGGLKSSYQLAIAAPRVWWLSNRNTGVELWTLPNPPGASDSPQQVNISIAPDSCKLSDSDASPWTTLDGSVMFFSATELDATCGILHFSADLYYVRLGNDGKPPALAQPISDLNLENINDVDPSMSPDLCKLNFSSARSSNRLRFWQAPRR